MNKWLDKHFYNNNSGQLDSIVDSLGNCVDQAAYVILKNQYCIPNIGAAFLNESTIGVNIDENRKLSSLYSIDNIVNKKLYSLYYTLIDSGDPVKTVSYLLNEGNIPIIMPIIERFRFSEHYDPSYTVKERRCYHAFVIVGEDEKNFFFADNPAIIIPSRFVPYEKNPEIGIIEKKEFSDAASDCCDIIDVKFHLNVIKKEIENWKKSFELSFDNYRLRDHFDDGIIWYYGRNAMFKLKELFESESMKFHELAPTKDRDLMTYFSWKIWIISGRRVMQRDFLLNNNSSVKSADDLIAALNDTIKYWNLLKKAMFKDYVNGAEIIGKKYIPIFSKLIDFEDKLNEEYSRYLYN